MIVVCCRLGETRDSCMLRCASHCAFRTPGGSRARPRLRVKCVLIECLVLYYISYIVAMHHENTLLSKYGFSLQT